MKFRSSFGRRPDRQRPHSPTVEHFSYLRPLESRPIMYSALTPPLLSPSLPFLSPSFLPESAVNTFLPHFHSIHSLFRPTNGLDWLPYPPPSPSGGSHWRLHSPINYPQGFLNRPRSAAESSLAPTCGLRGMDPSKVKSRCHVARSFFLPSPMEFPLERPGRPALTHSRGG